MTEVSGSRRSSRLFVVAPHLLLTLAAAAAIGCSLGDKASACGRVAEVLTLPEPTKPKTASASHLERAAKSFRKAAIEAKKLEQLPDDLRAIADQAAHQLTAAARQLDLAARAHTADKASEYAAARLKIEEARRALADVSTRFGKLCSH